MAEHFLVELTPELVDFLRETLNHLHELGYWEMVSEYEIENLLTRILATCDEVRGNSRSTMFAALMIYGHTWDAIQRGWFKSATAIKH